MTFRILTMAMILCSALLAACAGNDRPAADSGAGPGRQPSRHRSALSLAGRWTLSSTGTGSCAMTFDAVQDASEGTIAPAGGCPFNFFTSRK